MDISLDTMKFESVKYCRVFVRGFLATRMGGEIPRLLAAVMSWAEVAARMVCSVRFMSLQ